MLQYSTFRSGIQKIFLSYSIFRTTLLSHCHTELLHTELVSVSVQCLSVPPKPVAAVRNIGVTAFLCPITILLSGVLWPTFA